MSEIDAIVSAAATAGPPAVSERRPSRRLVVVTCMDVRIDPLRAFGLQLGEANVLRNGGGRVTDDVLRSVALSAHVLGSDTVAVVQHTNCGLTGSTDDELRETTGADIPFLTIADHDAAVTEDVDRLFATPYLEAVVREVAGLVYDVDAGGLREVVRRTRA